MTHSTKKQITETCKLFGIAPHGEACGYTLHSEVGSYEGSTDTSILDRLGAHYLKNVRIELHKLPNGMTIQEFDASRNAAAILKPRSLNVRGGFGGLAAQVLISGPKKTMLVDSLTDASRVSGVSRTAITKLCKSNPHGGICKNIHFAFA